MSLDYSHLRQKHGVQGRSAVRQFPGYPTRKFSQVRTGRSLPSVHPLINLRQIAVKDWKKVRSPITRSKLAYEIAKRVKLLLDASAVSEHASSTISTLRNKPTDTPHSPIYPPTVDDRAGLYEA